MLISCKPFAGFLHIFGEYFQLYANSKYMPKIGNICHSEICRYNPLNYFVRNKRTDHSQYEIVYAFLYMYLEIYDRYNKLKVQNC